MRLLCDTIEKALSRWLCLAACTLVCAATTAIAAPITIDFEGLTDSTLLTTQYPGVVFSNAAVITAGVSLNEFESPPHSGINVALDQDGPMSIVFSEPAMRFGGYFTYTVPITVSSFDIANNLLGSVTSAFTSNLAVSGDPGSSANEFLQLISSMEIFKVTIAGDLLGGSFTVDDVTIATVKIPEPSSTMLLLLAGLLLFLRRRRATQQRVGPSGEQ